MRLFQRTLSDILIVPRRVVTDALGGVREGFAPERIRLRGSVGYVSNTLNSTANAMLGAGYGIRVAQAVKLSFVGDVPINVGDGVMLPGDGAPCWRIVEVSRFPLITTARLERLAAREGAV